MQISRYKKHTLIHYIHIPNHYINALVKIRYSFRVKVLLSTYKYITFHARRSRQLSLSTTSISPLSQVVAAASTPREEGRPLRKLLRKRIGRGGPLSIVAVGLLRAFHHHYGHLNQLYGRLLIADSLRQVQNLTSHHRHLLLKHLLVETLIRLQCAGRELCSIQKCL